MKRPEPQPRQTTQSGYSLPEILVVMILIGILAGITYPQYFKMLERGRAGEAVETMNALNSAQSRYSAKYGGYCGNFATRCAGFDYVFPPLRYFVTPPPNPTVTANGWSLTLTRNSVYSSGQYGAYTITYSVPGNTLSCTEGDGTTSCTADLLNQF